MKTCGMDIYTCTLKGRIYNPVGRIYNPKGQI